jgi:PAS domain S-box-containing protein
MLPAALKGSVTEALQGEAGTFFLKGNYYVFSRKLAAAPWTFINLFEKDDLAPYLSLARTTFGIAAVVLSSLLLLTWFALRQRSAEEALGESERKYREVFNATSEAIIIHEAATGAILDVNGPMLEMYGYPREEALRLSINDLSADEAPYSQAGALRLIRKADEGEPQVFEWRAKRKNGELFWVEVTLKSSVIGGQGRVLAVVRDVSERKRLQVENLEFKDRVIEEMKYHEGYVSEIAHRLRNPLQVLMGHLEHFDASNLTSEQKESLETLRRSLEKIEGGVKKLT